MPSNNLLKAFDTKQKRFRSSWLKNATKSVGISIGSALEQVAPNTAELTKSGTEIARSVTMSLTRGRTGINRLTGALADNGYAKIGRTAIQNALDSIKTGKFGEAAIPGMMDMGGGGTDDGFSYGDDDTDSSSSDLSLTGLSSLSDQINRQSIAQIKTAQANMDTMISINSARMYQTQQISGEILSHITNIENSLASMVQFNNETMLKFVQASIGYYDRTGAAIAPDKKNDAEFSFERSDRPSNVFNNRNGGLSMAKYKEYIKKNIQKKIEDSGIPLDEDALEILASDPIGFATQYAATSFLEKFAGGAIKGIEDRISSAIPNALMSLSNLSKSDNPVLKLVGDIFGLRSEGKNGNFKDVKISKGPIPFDGETKHAITSIITHELRNQTGYLKVIADHLTGGDSDAAMANAREYYNDRTGKFERGMDIDLNIAKDIEDAITTAFKNTKFGTDMSSFTKGIKNEDNRKEVERMIDDMYMEILNSEKDSLTVEDLMGIINSMNDAPEEAKKILRDKIKAMSAKNKTAFMSLGIGKINARESYNDVFKTIRENKGYNYLAESGFMGLEGSELEEHLKKTLARGKGSHKFNKDEIEEIKKLVEDQTPDYFAKLAAEGKLNGLLAKFDNISQSDFDKLAKVGVGKADAIYKDIKKKIVDSEEFKSIKSTVGNIKVGAITTAKETAANVKSGSKSFIGRQVEDIGGGLSSVVSHLTGGLKTKTGMISRFIFGDQQRGTDGLFDGIAKSFNKGLKDADPDLEMTDGKKAVAMGGVGALTGAALAHFGFLPAILAGTGPIGGAIAGLTLAIAGAGPMFKKALFGGDVEEFEDDKGNKYSHKKKGLIGRIGTTLEVNLLNPIKTAAINAIGKTALNIEHGLLIPFKYLAEFSAKKIGKAVGNTFDFIGKVAGSFADENSFINKLTRGLFSTGTKAIGGAISGGINLASNIGSTVMNAPGNILGAALSILDPELAAKFDTERAGNRANKKALKEITKNRKKHDKNAQIIAKYTNGEYGEDSDEARAYLKKHNPEMYEKYFGENSGNIGTVDDEKGMKKLINESGGNITIDPSQYDAASQTAIYTARIVIMQEQLLRAFLGEKVEFSANSDATLSKGGHDRKAEKKAKAEKWRESAKQKYANGEELSEDEQKYINKLSDEDKSELAKQKYLNGKNLSDDDQKYIDALSEEDRKALKQKKEDAEEERKFWEDIKGRRGWVDAHIGKDKDSSSSFWDRISARFEQGRITRDIERHEEEKYGLRKSKKQRQRELQEMTPGFSPAQVTANGGEGFGGRGPEDDEENRKRAEIASEKAREGRLAAIERGKTIAEFKEEKEKKEDRDWKSRILKAVEGVKVENEEQHKSWKDIFSKKGLITAGLLLATPLLIKYIPKMVSWFIDNGPALMNGVITIASTVGEILAGIGRILPDIGDGGDLTNGNNIVENAQEFADRGVIGNAKIMRNGEIDNTSSAKLNVAANLVRIGAHADDYAKLGRQTVRFAKFRPIANFAAKNNNANRAIGKVMSGIKNAPKNIKNFGSKLFNKGTVGSTVANAADDVADSAVELMARAQQEGLENVAKASAEGAVKGGGGLFNKIKGFIGKFYDDILKKFTSKFGSTAPTLKAFAKEKLIDFLQKHFGKIGDKLASKLAAGTAGAGATLGLSELAFATLGAINGVTGAAKLFHVPSDSVDGTMRLISGIFGGIAGTTVGGVMDLLFQLIYQISGVDFLCGIATGLYTAVKKLTGKDADIEKLANAQTAMNTEYDEYKNTEIEKSYQTQLKAGLIPKDTTLEQFIAGVQDGTYKAVYDSQADYIAKNHGALSDKIMKGLGKGWKAVKAGAKLQYGGFETTYTDDKGNTYQKNADGNYDIITPDGENVGSVTKDMIPESAKKSTKFVSGFSRQLALGKKFIDNLATNEKTKNTILGKGANIVKDTAKKLSTFWDNVKEGGINFIKKNTIEDKVVYRPIDSPLSYYKYNKSKNTYTWYNQNGEVIQEDAKTYDEMMTLYGNGLVTKDASFNGVKTAVTTTVKDKLKSIGSTIGNLWNQGTTAIGNALNKAKNFIFGNNDNTPETSTEIGGNGRGGRGTLYSQNDSRWKNSSYGSDATMGDSGCGPTAVAMAMSDITGKRINPLQMAGLAEWTGDRDATGTNWNFVNNAASMMGVSSRQVYDPSASYIGSQLASGNEMILSGRTGGYGFGGFGSAYTPAGHYIVGTGIDRDGIVTYKDPTTGGYGRIPLGMLSAETGSAWSFGGRGPSAAMYTDDGSAYSGGVMSANSQYYRGNQRVNTAPVSTGNATTTSTKNSGLIGKMTIDTSGTNSLNYRPDNAYNQTSKKEGAEEYKRWLETVAYVKKHASTKYGRYDQGGSVTVEMPDGRKIKMRTDCSGFVSCCLDAYGAFKEGTKLNSSGFSSTSGLGSSTMKATGFIPLQWPGWDGLMAGDIIAKSGHVEIFAENDSNKHKVWNWGSGSSASNPGVTNSSKPSYTIIWRHPNATGDIILSDIDPDALGSANGDATISGSSTGANDWWEKITNAVSSFFSHTIGQFFSDKPTAWNRSMMDSDTSETSETVGENGATVSGTNSALPSGAPATSADAAKIYTKLRSLGLTPVAAAGVMGNWQQESSNNPDRFEADYSKMAKSRGGIDQIFASSENLNEYTKAVIMNTSTIKNKENALNKTYKGQDGNLYPGLGLAQWTGPRGYDLMKFANSKGTSWRDYDTQIEFFNKEFTDGGLLDEMNETETPEEAAHLFLDKFEGDPNNASGSRAQRQANAKTIYDQFGGAGRGISIHGRRPVTYNRKPTGGHGYSIKQRSGTGYYGPKYNPAYGGGYGVPNNTESLVREIVDLMYNLISVETGASGKLDALAKLKGSTNIIAAGGGSNGENTYLNLNAAGNSNTMNTSRNFKQAYKIATTV